LGILLVVGVAGALWIAREHLGDRLTIANRSGQPIARLKVNVAGQVTNFHEVPSGTEVTAPAGTDGDRRFWLEGQLADRTMLRGNGAVEGRVLISVLPGGLTEVRQSSR
jgi:hypothetical protein